MVSFALESLALMSTEHSVNLNFNIVIKQIAFINKKISNIAVFTIEICMYIKKFFLKLKNKVKLANK